MSKMSKAIAVLGVVAGLGVAALPLSTYAADPWGDAYTQSATAQVQVEVGGAISIATSIDGTNFDITTKTVNLGELMPGGITTDSTTPTLTVRVDSNDKEATYSLYMNGLKGETSMIGQSTGATIPTINGNATNDNELAKGSSAWGYKMNGTGSYAAIPSEPTKIVTSTKTAQATAGTNPYISDNTFEFAASASTIQTPDTYIGTVVFTAALEN